MMEALHYQVLSRDFLLLIIYVINLSAGVYDILFYLLGVTENKQYNSFKTIDMFNKILGVEDINGILTGFLTKQLFTQEEMENGDFREMAFGLMDVSLN